MATLLLPKLAAGCRLTALLLCAPNAIGQSVCSSDGEPTPLALFERFISADCETCWRDAATPVAASSALTLDWIVPGQQGEDAPLAAAARQEGLLRLAAQHWPVPKTQDHHLTAVSGLPPATLRVAHGMALGGYVGASIELTIPAVSRLATPIQAWLALVETLPIGVEATPVARNLVRNVLLTTWHLADALPFQQQLKFRESRPLNIPPGADLARLRVVGWVENAPGSLHSAAASVCHSEDNDQR